MRTDAATHDHAMVWCSQTAPAPGQRPAGALGRGEVHPRRPGPRGKGHGETRREPSPALLGGRSWPTPCPEAAGAVRSVGRASGGPGESAWRPGTSMGLFDSWTAPATWKEGLVGDQGTGVTSPSVIAHCSSGHWPGGKPGPGGSWPAPIPPATAEILRSLGVPVPALPSGGEELRIPGVGLRGLRTPLPGPGLHELGNHRRLLLGILAGQPLEATLTGDESLRKRPMARGGGSPGGHGGSQVKVVGGGRFRAPTPTGDPGGPLRPLQHRSPWPPPR